MTIRLRHRLKKLLWPLLPKPWASPIMECRYGLWIGLSGLYSVSGRQLGEENTRPFSVNHHLPAEKHACKYPGSRMGHPINMSALRIAMANFDAALAIVGAVRRQHVTRIGSPAVVGLWDLYILSRASIAIIAWQQRARAYAPHPHYVSDDLASLYQFISGIFMICRDMMNSNDRRIAANTIMTADELYEYADSHGIFLSPDGMACAGSVAKIKEFIDYCLRGVAQSGIAACDPLDDLVADREGWYRYALMTIELDCFIEQEATRHRAIEQPERSADHAAIAAIYAALSAHCMAIPGAPDPLPPHTNVASAVLARQNRILAQLGRAPVDQLAAKHLAARLARD